MAAGGGNGDGAGDSRGGRDGDFSVLFAVPMMIVAAIQSVMSEKD